MSFFGLGGTAETANLAVNLKLNNETKGPLNEATAGFSGLEKNVTKLGGPGFGPLGKAADGLHTMGVGALAAAGGIGAVAGILIESTKAAIDEQESIDRLDIALRDNATNWNGNTTAVEAAIKAGERLAFNADDQRNALAGLVTHTHDVAKATELLATAEDLARAKGIDLTTASSILGKVYDGNFAAASKMGIAIKKGATATEVLAQIQSSAAGQAEKYGHSIQGAADRAAIAWHDAEVTLGQGLAPIVTAGANALVDLVDQVGKTGTAFDDLHRFIDPAYAAMEDVRLSAERQAGNFGVTTAAIDAYLAAQQEQKTNLDSLIAKMNAEKSALDAMAAGQAAVTSGALDSTTAFQMNAQNVAISRQETEAYTDAQRKQAQATIDAAHAVLSKTVVDETAARTLAAKNQIDQQDYLETIRDTRAKAEAAKVAAAYAATWTDSIDRSTAATERNAIANADWSDSVDRGAAAFVSNAAVLRRATQVVYGPLGAEAEAAAKKAEAYVAAIPVLSSQKFRDGIGLVKAAMAEYKLAITQPVSKATELAAIQSALTSRKIRHGLKSHNPQIRQDTKDLVNWLIAERDRLNGTVTFRGYVSGSLSESIQKYRRDHPGDVKFPGKAAGGAVAAGGAYTVGENGPETLVMGDASGTIVPNGGSRLQVNVTVKNTVSSVAIHDALITGTADHTLRPPD